jgi:hypothetical protein
MTPPERFIDLLVLKTGGFEPIIVDKIFVEIGRSLTLTPVMRTGEVFHGLLIPFAPDCGR